MTAVLFSPHNDDETLFAFHTMRRHEAECVVVLRSMRQERQQGGPSYLVRERETLCATTVAGVRYTQWPNFHDDTPNWADIAECMEGYVKLWTPDVVIAPAYEDGGHEDHNAIANICSGLEGDHELVRYLTYMRGHGRSESEHEVVPTFAERAQKAAALRCYGSQRKHPPTAPWFGEDQREFLAS